MAERETPDLDPPDPADPEGEKAEERRPELEEAILVLADLVSLEQ